MRHPSSPVFGACLLIATALACGGSSSTTTGPFPPGPSCPSGNPAVGPDACSQCSAAHCTSAQDCQPTACADITRCACGCNIGDSTCAGRCIASTTPTASCTACQSAIQQCQDDNCSSVCPAGSTTVTVPGDSGAGPGIVLDLDASVVVDPATLTGACALMATCCESIVNAELKASCLSGLPADPVSCALALALYEGLGFCE